MPRKLITAPAIEPVSVAEVKTWGQIDGVDLDHKITALIPAARSYIERWLDRVLVAQTWDVFYDDLCDDLEMPVGPLISVTYVKYLDSNGVLQTLDPTTYVVNSVELPGEVCTAFGKVWPPTYPQDNAVTVRAVLGYGTTADDVPHEIRLAIKMLVVHWIDNSTGDMPEHIAALLWPSKSIG